MFKKLQIIILLFCVNSVFAQAGKTSLEFSCVIWKDLDFKEEIFYHDGKEFIELDLKPRQRSQLYEIKNFKKGFSLYTPAVNDEGEKVYKLIGKTSKVPASNRVLFFIEKKVKIESDELPLFIYGMDDSLTSFPVGSFKFVNSMNEPVTVQFPKKSKSIKSRGVAVLQPDIPKLGGMLPIYITDASKDKLYGSRFFAQPRGRKLVFIQKSNNPKRKVKLRFLPQIIPVPKVK